MLQVRGKLRFAYQIGEGLAGIGRAFQPPVAGWRPDSTIPDCRGCRASECLPAGRRWNPESGSAGACSCWRWRRLRCCSRWVVRNSDSHKPPGGAGGVGVSCSNRRCRRCICHSCHSRASNNTAVRVGHNRFFRYPSKAAGNNIASSHCASVRQLCGMAQDALVEKR